MSGRWPEPEDARGLLGPDTLGRLAMQIVCPHTNTSKIRNEDTSRTGIRGTEYCNTCGATRRYYGDDLTGPAY